MDFYSVSTTGKTWLSQELVDLSKANGVDARIETTYKSEKVVFIAESSRRKQMIKAIVKSYLKSKERWSSVNNGLGAINKEWWYQGWGSEWLGVKVYCRDLYWHYLIIEKGVTTGQKRWNNKGKGVKTLATAKRNAEYAMHSCLSQIKPELFKENNQAQ